MHILPSEMEYIQVPKRAICKMRMKQHPQKGKHNQTHNQRGYQVLSCLLMLRNRINKSVLYLVAYVPQPTVKHTHTCTDDLTFFKCLCKLKLIIKSHQKSSNAYIFTYEGSGSIYIKIHLHIFFTVFHLYTSSNHVLLETFLKHEPSLLTPLIFQLFSTFLPQILKICHQTSRDVQITVNWLYHLSLGIILVILDYSAKEG